MANGSIKPLLDGEVGQGALKRNAPPIFTIDRPKSTRPTVKIELKHKCVIPPRSLSRTSESYAQATCTLVERLPGPYRSRKAPHRTDSRSETLNKAERNYSATERECLALVYGITTCRPYLQFEHFDAYTDHQALRLLTSIDDPSGRLMRWRLRLSEYSFDVHYKKGVENQLADAASRVDTAGPTTEEEDL